MEKREGAYENQTKKQGSKEEQNWNGQKRTKREKGVEKTKEMKETEPKCQKEGNGNQRRRNKGK
jgi:hypothetical protein